jgi:hypothetical protein
MPTGGILVQHGTRSRLSAQPLVEIVDESFRYAVVPKRAGGRKAPLGTTVVAACKLLMNS